MTDLILYETPAPGVARIVLNRPEARNAQSADLLFALNEAFDRAAGDEAIKAIILAASGDHFSAGHDLKWTTEEVAAATAARPRHVSNWSGFGEAGSHGWFAVEQEIYVQNSRRWRNIPKPTIAEVRGRCIAGGLILAWVCDLIVASENALFSDPVVAFGAPGVEWFVHPWELGARKAKELLFTAEGWSAEEAWRLGMVNHVVPDADLADFTLDLASRIADKPAFALKLAKLAVNGALDIQGQASAIDMAVAYHHLAHAHNQQLFGYVMEPTSLPRMTRLRRSA